MASNWAARAPPARRGGASSSLSSRNNSSGAQPSTSTTIFSGGVKDPSGRTTEYSSMDDQCPVCKSDRYLNPKLRLLVGSCYHKMCESCSDRLFTLGPAPCPICSKVLRKLAFIPQTFEDLGVEKEVAIRRRIAKEFNKRREDFSDLRAFNDYLEEVEDITFNLINEIDVAKTEERIQAYHLENAQLIELNIQREENYALGLKDQEERDRLEKEERARELKLLDEQERLERERDKKELIDRLEHSRADEDAEKIIKRSKAERIKRSNLRTSSAATASSRAPKRPSPVPVVPDVPHVPLSDDWYAYEDKFVLRPQGYDDPLNEAVRKGLDHTQRIKLDLQLRAGGYMIEQAWERAIRCAVAGLEIPPLKGLPGGVAPGTPAMAGQKDVDMAATSA